jgi:hypothetical protein
MIYTSTKRIGNLVVISKVTDNTGTFGQKFLQHVNVQKRVIAGVKQQTGKDLKV